MEFEQEHALETYKSMITIGTEALKALQLINGGAVAALLAYLGQAARGSELAAAAGWPIALFVIGLVAATAAFLGIYLTQFALLNEFFDKDSDSVTHMRWLKVTVGLGVASLGLFAWGSLAAVNVLSRG
jgi:hypothetical protein